MGSNFIENFENALKDDLNTPKAISHLFELSNQFFVFLNKYPKLVKFSEAKYLIELIEKADYVFGLNLLDFPELPDEIRELMELRKKAKSERDYSLADQIRDKIKDKGYIVEDTPWGTRCRKI